MIINNPRYNSLPEQVEQNRKDIEEIKQSHLVDVDDELSTQSTNAVQNKVITEALNTEEFERKQADEDLEDADTTLQGNIDAEALAREQADQNLQNQLIYSQETYATPNDSVILQGVCSYRKMGKLVIVNIRDLVLKEDTGSNDVLIFSNLPKPVDYQLFILPSFYDAKQTRLKLVTENNKGAIKNHYDGTSSYGDSNCTHSGIICYFTEE